MRPLDWHPVTQETTPALIHKDSRERVLRGGQDEEQNAVDKTVRGSRNRELCVFGWMRRQYGVGFGWRCDRGPRNFYGSGNLSGTSDENNGGVITSNSVFTGTYSVDTDGLGRGVITLAGDSQPKPFHLVSPGKAFVIDTSGSAEAGMFEPQAAAFSATRRFRVTMFWGHFRRPSIGCSAQFRVW